VTSGTRRHLPLVVDLLAALGYAIYLVDYVAPSAG
jgi:hypothetical protein